MPDITLVSRREALKLAERAFHAAATAKKRAKIKLAQLTAAAKSAEAKSTHTTQLLAKSKAQFAQLKHVAKEARDKADKLHAIAADQWKCYQDALERSDASQKAAKRKIEELRQAAEAAREEANAAEQEACEAETELTVADDEMENLTDENQELARAASAAERRRAEAEADFDEADRDFGDKETEVEETKAEVLSVTVTAEKLDGEWQRVSHLRRSRRTPGYLKIRVTSKEIDADAAEAINRLSGGPVALAIHERDLRQQITQHGIASEVAAVTKELNRRRRSEAQNRVLAATYFETLLALMNHNTGDVIYPKTTDELVQEISDTSGFVEAILIYQLESENGPLKRFALELIDIVSTRKKIKIASDFERNLLADQLRARL